MTSEEIEAAVGRAIDSKLGQFYIDREAHYQDHHFIQEFRKWTEQAKGTVLSVAIKTLVTMAIGLLVLGFLFWGKGNFGK